MQTLEIVDNDRGIKVKLEAIISEKPGNTLDPNEPQVYQVDGYIVKDIIFDFYETDNSRVMELLEVIKSIAERSGIGKEDIYTEECMGVNYYQTFNEIISILQEHLKESRKGRK